MIVRSSTCTSIFIRDGNRGRMISCIKYIREYRVRAAILPFIGINVFVIMAYSKTQFFKFTSGIWKIDLKTSLSVTYRTGILSYKYRCSIRTTILTNIYSVGISRETVCRCFMGIIAPIYGCILLSKLPSKVSNTESPSQVMVSPPIAIFGAVSIVILSEADPVHPFSSVIVTETVCSPAVNISVSTGSVLPSCHSYV